MRPVSCSGALDAAETELAYADVPAAQLGVRGRAGGAAVWLAYADVPAALRENLWLVRHAIDLVQGSLAYADVPAALQQDPLVVRTALQNGSLAYADVAEEWERAGRGRSALSTAGGCSSGCPHGGGARCSFPLPARRWSAARGLRGPQGP